MARESKYPREVRERAVRMVAEVPHLSDHCRRRVNTDPQSTLGF